MCVQTQISQTIICLHVHLCKYSNIDENKHNRKILKCKGLKHGMYFTGEQAEEG